MKIEIIKQQKNPFLQREEILIKIDAESNPSFEDIKKEIGKDNKLTVIKKIEGNFGAQTFNAEIFIYNSEEAREKIEVIPKKIKKKIEEEARKASEVKAEEEAKVQEAKLEEVKA